MTKAFRHGQILKIIRSRNVFTQEELAGLLREQSVETTQVTLSRDMRELSIVKTGNGYRELERETAAPQFASLAAEFVQDVRLAQNLIVLKTSPGHASSVTVALDEEEWPEITGTIAGDDTILVICPDNSIAEVVRAKFFELLES